MPESKLKGFFKRLWVLIVTTLKTFWHDLGNLWKYVTRPEWRKKIIGDLWGFLKQVFKRIRKERVLREAGSLTYITILGFVPFVVFIIMIAPDLPFLNLKEKIFEIISNNLMPTSALAVNNIIEGMLGRRAGFNVLNFVVMIVSSYSLFRVIRDSFDRILSLNYRSPQDIVSHVIKFLGTIILGVFIMIVLFSSTSLPLISRLLKMPMLQWLTYLVPFVIQFVLLVFLYTMMPSMKAGLSSLVRGAFWTAVIWMAVKGSFDFYIYRMTNYQAIYGALSALPILLLWIYMNWVIILGGIVMVAVFESRKRPDLAQEKPSKMVRLTLEMYSDDKLNQRLEQFLSRKELKNLADTLNEEQDK
jgi:membrane protein